MASDQTTQITQESLTETGPNHTLLVFIRSRIFIHEQALLQQDIRLEEKQPLYLANRIGKQIC